MPAQVEFETIPQLFTRLVDHYRGNERTVLRHKPDDTWLDISWEELEKRVQSMAGFLHKQGVRPGDRVAILSENRPEWAITDLATQILGGINVSIYNTLPASKVAYILNDSGAKWVIVSVPVQRKKVEAVLDECPALEGIVVMSALPDGAPDAMVHWEEALQAGHSYWKSHRETLRKLGRDVSPSDTSALIYTSGTTGDPKGVMLSHRNFCVNAKGALDRVSFHSTDHHLSFLPLCHAFERTAGYTAVLAAGAKISYAESIEALTQNLTEVKPTVLISVPRVFEKVYSRVREKAEQGSAIKQGIFNWAVGVGERYAEAEQDGSAGLLLSMQQKLAHKLVFSELHKKLGGNLRFAASGGAALPKEIGRFFQAAGIVIAEGYGLTETAPVLSVNPLEAPRFGTVGHIVPDVTVAIKDLNDDSPIGTLSGNDYPSSLTTEEGEIVVKGPNVMEAYWKRPEETRGAFDADGWYHTGDVGRFVDGYLQVTDRIKHMLVSQGGKNIYPGPIEEYFKTKAPFDQVVVLGDDRPFLTALIVPDFDAVRLQARDSGEPEHRDDNEALVEERWVDRLFSKHISAYNKQAPAHEKIRAFHLVAEPFTVENGMLTPTLKNKRRVIEDEYADEIDAMYERFARRSS
ncbi:MAG: long-chain fatty acid--CoA ligase [Longimonas sp.]|uniref:AMP-dependent synthetase/ligase n=1 Tax=Longimonas sp. TaxID=2039626 RepID=UPI003346ED5E